jgi:hypothetical protein
MNPFFLYLDAKGSLTGGTKSNGQPQDPNFRIVAKQASLFPILPSITWNFKFGFNGPKKNRDK